MYVCRPYVCLSSGVVSLQRTHVEIEYDWPHPTFLSPVSTSDFSKFSLCHQKLGCNCRIWVTTSVLTRITRGGWLGDWHGPSEIINCLLILVIQRRLALSLQCIYCKCMCICISRPICIRKCTCIIIMYLYIASCPILPLGLPSIAYLVLKYLTMPYIHLLYATVNISYAFR